AAAPVVVESRSVKVVESPPAEAAPPPSRPARRPSRRTAPKVVDVKPPAPSPTGAMERIKRLEARVLALDGDKTTAKLLARLSMVRAAGASPRASAQLDRIEATLVKLETDETP
ncbi:MAG: hypothetical protein AAF480_15570, partial [Actinomycetota bacterium]